MSCLEWRIVDRLGEPVDEGLDVAWVIYGTRAKAEDQRRALDRDQPDGAPHELQKREVGSWEYCRRGKVTPSASLEP